MSGRVDELKVLLSLRPHRRAAWSTGEYTLAGCTVAPGFEFEDLEFQKPTGP